METLRKMKQVGTTAGIVLVVAGSIFILMPLKVVDLLAIVAGLIVASSGAYKLLSTGIKWKNIGAPVWHLIIGIATLGIGIYILINTNVTISLIGIIIAICSILASIDRFSVAVERKRAGLKIVPTVLFGVLHLCFGIVMILIPKAGPALIIMVSGTYLLIAGIMVLTSVFFFKDLQ